MKTWMTAFGIFAVGAGAMAAVVVMAAKPASSAGPHQGGGHSDYRAVDQWLKEFDRVVADGRGFGLAFAADQQGYPGPMHVLELKDRLRLTSDQERAAQLLVDAMFAQSRPAGARLLAAEQRLRTVFSAGTASEAAVRAAAADIERARTEVRLVHLLAHLKTREILSVEQRGLYHAARWKK
ncbi:MAG: periplasmic heavy metal sensor [Gammaproteobacteria bacterium]